MGKNQIGNYVLEERIGHGTTGRVWRVRQVDTQNLFAVKVLRGELADDPEVRSKFITEGRLLAGRDLPGIVRVHEVIDEEDNVALVMDWIDGGDLRALITDGPVPPQRAAMIASEVSRGLAAAHAAGMVHMDVKPENILLQSDGTPRLTDFGLAKTLDGSSSSRSHSRIAGTPHYTAPETFSGHRSGAPADVYALGVILYEMIMGWRPFRAGDQAALMRQHVEQQALRPPAFPQVLWDLVAQCLDKNPDRRPTASSAAERLHTASAVLGGLDPLPPTDPPTQQELTTEWKNKPVPESPNGSRRPRAFIALVAISLATVLVGSLVALNQFVWSRASGPGVTPSPTTATLASTPTETASAGNPSTSLIAASLPPTIPSVTANEPNTQQPVSAGVPQVAVRPTEATTEQQPPVQRAPEQAPPAQPAPVPRQAAPPPAPVQPAPKAPAATKRPACNSSGPLLGPGSRGASVKEAQTLLKKKGHPEVGAIDGIWGPNTATATRNFQRSSGLAVDGLIGPDTWCKLRS